MSTDLEHACKQAVSETDFAVFMDVLGYGSLLLDGSLGADHARLRHLLEVWEALTSAIDHASGLFQVDQAKLFSDSLFVSDGELVKTVAFAANVYANAYLFYENLPDRWMPWIRGGVGSGWLVDMLDTTLSSKVAKSQHAYNNPAGPAVARAYHLAEKSGLKGMRLLIPEDLMTQAWMEMSHASYPNDLPLKHARVLLTKSPWPSARKDSNGEIFDVPWWWLLDDGLARWRVLRAHEWQAVGPGRDHYEETDRLLQIDP